MPSQSFLTGNFPTAPPVDHAIARYAGRQHALVRLDQLHAAGLSNSAVTKRVARGVLFRRYRGVYIAGQPTLSREGEFLAAAYAGGVRTLLTGDALVELLGLGRYRAPVIDVLVPGKRRSPPGVRFHEATIHPRDRTTFNRIPVATIPRLLVDLTEVRTAHEITKVIHEAAFRGWFSLLAARDAIARANGRHHLDRLEEAIEYHLTGSTGVRSRNEVRFLAMLHEAGIAEPRVNVQVEGWEVDCHWPERKLVIEIDGPAHNLAPARRTDAQRDRDLTAKGWTVLRFPEDRLQDALEAASGW